MTLVGLAGAAMLNPEAAPHPLGPVEEIERPAGDDFNFFYDDSILDFDDPPPIPAAFRRHETPADAPASIIDHELSRIIANAARAMPAAGSRKRGREADSLQSDPLEAANPMNDLSFLTRLQTLFSHGRFEEAIELLSDRITQAESVIFALGSDPAFVQRKRASVETPFGVRRHGAAADADATDAQAAEDRLASHLSALHLETPDPERRRKMELLSKAVNTLKSWRYHYYQRYLSPEARHAAAAHAVALNNGGLRF